MLLSTAWPPAVRENVSIAISCFNQRTTGRLTLLKDHGHGTTLVKNTQLALRGLLVGRVGEDTAVKQRPVSVGNHGADVTGRVGLLGVLDGVAPLLGGDVPVLAVSLVARVDGALLGHLHVGVGEDELAERVVHGEAVDGAVLHGHDKLGGGAVHGEASGDKLCTGEKQVLLLTLGVIGESVDTEDGADRDTSVQVARSVNGVTSNGVLCVGTGRELDELLLLL